MAPSSHPSLLHAHTRLSVTSQPVRSLTVAHRRASQTDHDHNHDHGHDHDHKPKPKPTSPPPPSQYERANPRSAETDPCATARDTLARARQRKDIDVPGLMPELQEAILRHPGVEATMVVREEKIPRELEVPGEETQHASGFIPPTPGLPREPQWESRCQN
ncbi:hypothetical protein LshimejAT787_1204800 [Lyophyllum shimeji]|uniref:Uncharacterized protein n=1 Tax=Lyophyllum shimeji TaxID=47721 RepID=A0A9P3UUC2_LYOSH|nr:hypothetical protein LshimejAT787_1204800 [Lyophyllum shimeji]